MKGQRIRRGLCSVINDKIILASLGVPLFHFKSCIKINFMKKILFILGLCVFSFACNQGADKPATTESADHDHDQSIALTLNNGAKWKADSITGHNVVVLKTIADNFKIKPFPSTNDYQLLSGDLNTALNTMIQQCKMTGPDHDALHHWLEPVLKETNKLKNTADTTAARSIFKSIDEQIDNYHNYFE